MWLRQVHPNCGGRGMAGIDTKHWVSDSCPNTPIWLRFEPWDSEGMPISFERVVRALQDRWGKEATHIVLMTRPYMSLFAFL